MAAMPEPPLGCAGALTLEGEFGSDFFSCAIAAAMAWAMASGSTKGSQRTGLGARAACRRPAGSTSPEKRRPYLWSVSSSGWASATDEYSPLVPKYWATPL
eukprot:scaffold14177_cov124-Isochrysis_galbana.AAC.2